MIYQLVEHIGLGLLVWAGFALSYINQERTVVYRWWFFLLTALLWPVVLSGGIYLALASSLPLHSLSDISGDDDATPHK